MKSTPTSIYHLNEDGERKDYCPYCLSEIKQGKGTCPECGAELNTSSTPEMGGIIDG